MRMAVLNDVITTKVTMPYKATLRAKLTTPESVVLGNEILLAEGSGWVIEEKAKITDPDQ